MAGENSNRMRNSQSNNTSRNTRRAQTDGVDLKQTLVSLNNSVDNLSKSLSSQEKALKDLGVILDKQHKKEEDLLDKEKKAREEHLARSKKIADSVVNTVWSVAKQVMGFFTNSMHQIQSSYNTNFSEITSKLDITASQYTQAYRDAAADLRNAKLNLQFDSTDFMESLKENLAQGLRGDQAQQKALSDLISKKLVPSINTNTRSYVQSYKLLGDSFSKYSIGIARLNQTMGKSMEYYEQGLYTTTQEQFGNLLYGLGLGSSDIAQFHDVFAQLTSQYGSEYANEIISTINAGLNGVVNTPLALAGYGTAEKLASAIQSGRFGDVIGQLVGTQNRLVSGQNLTTANVMGQAGILGTSAGNALYGLRVGEFDYTKYTNGEILAQTVKDNSKLQQGYYQSVTKRMEKYNNNLEGVVNASTWLAEHIPDQIQQLGHTIESGVLDIIHAITGGTLKEALSRGLGNLIAGGASSAASRGTGTGLGSVALGTGASVAGIVLGTAIKIGQGIYDNIEIGNEQGTDNSFGAGARRIGKRLLGISNYDEHSLEYKLQNYEIDWGEVGLTAAGAGAIGAGVGSFIPGVGTVIGAGVSALVSAGVNFFSQLEKKAEYKNYVESQKALTQSTEALQQAQLNYQSVVESTSTTEELLKVASNKNNKNYNDAVKSLIETYQDYIPEITDVSQWTDKQVEAIKYVIEQEKLLAEIKAREAARGAYESAVKASSLNGAGLTDELYNALAGASSSEDLAKLVAGRYGLDVGQLSQQHLEAFRNEVNKEAGQGVLRLNSQGQLELTQADIKSISNIKRRNQISATELEAMLNYQSGLKNDLLSMVNAIDLERYMDNPDTYTYLNSRLREIEEVANKYNLSVDQALQLHVGTFGPADRINELLEHYGVPSNQVYPLRFKTGIQYVPEDNYPALLHRGERVLTASESQALSSLGLQYMSSRLQITPVVQQSTVNSIETATLSIKESVDTIVIILSDILTRFDNVISSRSVNTSSISYNSGLLNFEGGAFRDYEE